MVQKRCSIIGVEVTCLDLVDIYYVKDPMVEIGSTDSIHTDEYINA